MANRNFAPPKGYLEKGVVKLYFTIATGASGAVGAASAGKGFSGVVRNSAGNYTLTITAPDKYRSLLGGRATVRGPAGTGVPAAGKAVQGVLFNPLLGTNSPNTIQLQMLDDASAGATPAAAVDVTDNWFIDIELVLKDSTV